MQFILVDVSLADMWIIEVREENFKSLRRMLSLAVKMQRTGSEQVGTTNHT